MNDEGIFDIALFPIPGSVSFPQTIVPLHVFEPRYRQMIQDCIVNGRLLGVCHTKSIERFAPLQIKHASNEEELHKLYRQNLTTFSPEDVFSAGSVEITEQTEDGRYLISIFMLKRFRILEVVQDKPYKIAKCEEYQDNTIVKFEDLPNDVFQKRQFIVDSIEFRIPNLDSAIGDQLKNLKLEKLVNDFTFKVFRFARMSEFEMQKILNSRDPLDRLETLFEYFKTE